jgi:phosphohistidine phosphatase
MGRFLREEAYVPDLVLCSDSARTRETLDLAMTELRAKPRIKFRRELYLAEPELILSVIRRAPAKCGVLMVVGHNPGLEQCALTLASTPLEKKLRKRYDSMDEKFPTCALAVIDFEVAKWGDITPGRGELEAFLRPKDLDD